MVMSGVLSNFETVNGGPEPVLGAILTPAQSCALSMFLYKKFVTDLSAMTSFRGTNLRFRTHHLKVENDQTLLSCSEVHV